MTFAHASVRLSSFDNVSFIFFFPLSIDKSVIMAAIAFAYNFRQLYQKKKIISNVACELLYSDTPFEEIIKFHLIESLKKAQTWKKVHTPVYRSLSNQFSRHIPCRKQVTKRKSSSKKKKKFSTISHRGEKIKASKAGREKEKHSRFFLSLGKTD